MTALLYGRAAPSATAHYDPRALELDGAGGVLHAKAVVADDEAVFVTSANLTEATLDRNIEVGLLGAKVSGFAGERGKVRTRFTKGGPEREVRSEQSCLAMVTLVYLGFPWALALGAACYVVAAATLPRLRPPGKPRG